MRLLEFYLTQELDSTTLPFNFQNVSWGLAYIVLGVLLIALGGDARWKMFGLWFGVGFVFALIAGLGVDLQIDW